MIKKIYIYFFPAMLLGTWLILCTVGLPSCFTPTSSCTKPIGAWGDREGKELVFLKEGQALWLTRFGSQADTQTCTYRMDCKKEPISLDLADFNTGPFKGKTLQGIMEWSNDTSFRWQFDAAERPVQFDVDAAIKMYKLDK